LRLAQWLKRLRVLLLQAHLVVLALVLQPAQQLALLVQLRLVRLLVLLLQPLLLRVVSQQQLWLVAWWWWARLSLLLHHLVAIAVAVQQPLQQTNLSCFDYPHSLSGDFVFVEGLF
jgi:hypothetical protein